MDNAQAIFERLKTADELRKLVEEGTREGLFLEFKTATTPLSKSDKQNLSRVVSGFANSGGGVVLWGIAEGEKHAAGSMQLIDDGVRFQDEVNALLPNAVVPFHSVEMHSIQFDERAGVVVMYVAESDRKPHRASLSVEKGYFKRVQDSFRIMEHFDLEDMFGRSQRPAITPVFTEEPAEFNNFPSNSTRDPSRWYRPFYLTVALRNEGRATGKHAICILRFPPDTVVKNVESGMPEPVFRPRPYPEPVEQVEFHDQIGVVHIDMNVRIMKLLIALPRSVDSRNLGIYWTIVAENMRPQRGHESLEHLID